MYLTTLRAVGGSVMFAIPNPILEGDIEPQGRPRYALADLLAECDSAVAATDEHNAWLASEPVGREAL